MELYKGYLTDLVALLKADLEQAKSEQRTNNEYDMGYTMGLYHALYLIKTQAEAFEIPLEDIGLENYPLESFL